MTRRTACILVAMLLFVRAAPAGPSASNPLSTRRLYVNPNSDAARQAAEWQRSRPQDSERMRRMAAQPQAIWLGGWSGDVRATISDFINKAGSALPVFVAYNIPYRDCGLYSAGGARGGDAYRRWINEMARGINNRASVVILEPDALSNLDCLPLRLKDERYVLLREAAQKLTQAGATVYIDAGHPKWKPVGEMSGRLKNVGIADAMGFALNVSNYHPTALNITYGNRLSALVGGKHYVIDTSRNGTGSAGKDWCNAAKQALGPAPTTQTGQALVDAYLWVKSPGQSDGQCGGGPAAGKWWADYALELIKMAETLGGTLPR